MYSNVPSSFIHNSPKLETTQMCINKEWRNKVWYLNTIKNILPQKKNAYKMHISQIITLSEGN